MGHSQSAQYNDLVKFYNPFEWRLIDDHPTYQVWQSIAYGKRHAVYPIDFSQADSQQNIQIYHFRKLNYLHLVSVQAILKNRNESFCGDPKSLRVLIENIPVRLAQINNKIGFLERLTILSATFAALHTINYIYGPLYVTEQMIGFAQNGKPKVWINQDFSKNEPSRSAKGEITQNSAIQQLQLLQNEMLIAEEMLNCVTQVFKTAGNSDVETYPLDFRIQAANVRTFAEGEQLIQSYCRNKGIQLNENVSFWDYVKDTESQCSGTHIQTWRSMLPPSKQNLQIQSLDFKQQRTQRPKRESGYGNMDQSTTRLNAPRVLFSSGCNGSNTRVVINYGAETIVRSNKKQVVTSMIVAPFVTKVSPLIVPHTVVLQTNAAHVPNNACNNQQRYVVVEKKETSLPKIQTVVSENIVRECVGEPLAQPLMIYSDLQNSKHRYEVAQSLEQLSAQHKQKIINKKKELVVQVHQTQPQAPKQQNLEKIIVPKVISQYYMSQSHAENSSNLTGFNTIDQIKLWEASLLMKISHKQAAEEQKAPAVAQYEPQGYQSCQSQEDSGQVRFGGEENGSVQNLKDMQAYIRNKYRDYLTSNHQNAADGESDSSGGNDKFYSFGLKATGKVHRGRQNSLTNLKPNVFRRTPSISDNVSVFDTKDMHFKEISTGFMSKAIKLGIDSESKIIYEQSARQSGRESESENKYTTFGKIDLYAYNKQVDEPVIETSNAKSKKEYNSSYGKLEDRYNKYVMNKSSNRIGSNKNQSLKLIQAQAAQLSSKKQKQKASYFVDKANDSRKCEQSNFRYESKLMNEMSTPRKHVKRSKESIPSQITYDNLRDLLRK